MNFAAYRAVFSAFLLFFKIAPRHIHLNRDQPLRCSMEFSMQANLTPQNGQATPNDLIKDSDTANFAKDVMEASKTTPVLVDFWAPWCGPCKQLGPMIEKVVTQAGGKVKLVKIDIDQNQGIAGQLGIQSIPAVIAFVDGQPVDGFMGGRRA